MDSGERLVRIETIRVPKYRPSNGSCLALATDIETNGLHRPVVLWSDGTLISGQRRVFAHYLLHRERIQAVHVNTIEEAAKLLLDDNRDEREALPMKWSDVCRLWEVLGRLDEPAAVRRTDEARRRGVELRRKTQAGQRKPGRLASQNTDYALGVICEPFGISYATARRIRRVYRISEGIADLPDQRELAKEVMADIDAGGSIWANYQRLLGSREPTAQRIMPPPPTVDPAPARSQLAAWAKSLPQMEGLTVGLLELGPPNPDLTWDQVGPVHTRLMNIRRTLEKMIKQMREIDKS